MNHQVEKEQLQRDGTQINDQREALGKGNQPNHQQLQQEQIPGKPYDAGESWRYPIAADASP